MGRQEKQNNESIDPYFLSSSYYTHPGVIAEKVYELDFTGSRSDSSIHPTQRDEKLKKIFVNRFWADPSLFKSNATVAYWNLAIEDYLIRQEAIKAIDTYKRHIRENKNVSKIAYNSSGNTVTIWTLLKKFNRKSLYEVYAIEEILLQEFPSLIFDFNALVSDAEPIPSNLKQEEI